MVMMGRPSAILEVIWIVWLCSWVAASFWSGRTLSRIGSLDTWTYRAVMIVWGILLVPLTAHVLGEKPGIYLKASSEKSFLRVELGPDIYESYRRRVPMLIPFLKPG